MASPATAGDIKDDAICSICLGYLTEPVTIVCGHNFCRACITQYCAKKGTGTPLTCPQCRAQFQKGEFRPNTQLNNIVQKLKQLRLKPGKGQKEKLCERHEERLKLFCEEDGETICLVCEKSRDHKSHTVVPMEEAAQEYKRKVKNKKETIVGEFNKLHTLLREEEQLLLQSLEEEERATLQRLQENVTKLSRQSSSLQQLITEIEEKCQQPVIKLLKDVKSTLSRSENVKLQELEAVSTDLKNVYKISLDMREALKRFGARWTRYFGNSSGTPDGTLLARTLDSGRLRRIGNGANGVFSPSFSASPRPLGFMFR
ncbi:delta(3,5)-Delta(2,4)-dienoyl-CoA isomerase, mitochondrial [Platysternon megacephalum]|uniref:RING-type E3 ubiquitin transferase n=1 Tax=Platysternon megacephalum TaxID=55544 RepID=A0A4D9DM75_9SAUR|nr:delta(3,5)-Delta(2,4)-dienoyl-CoA isomerase, mitochondrial [Platysternon megacephalum]